MGFFKKAQSREEMAYAKMIYAMIIRSEDRHLVIKPDEIPNSPFRIAWRPTDDGGLEAKLTMSDKL